MANRFKNKKNNFTQISNQVLLDKELSLKAKGLYSIIQHYITIPDFILYLNTLKKVTKEGKHSFESAWKELKQRGYLTQEKKRNSKTGKFFYEYELLDIPQPENPVTDNPEMENPYDGKVGLYNNTDLSNTNLNNIDAKNTDKNNYRVQETCTRLPFSEILSSSYLSGSKEVMEDKIHILLLFFKYYKKVTGYNKHFDISKDTWRELDEQLDFILEFSEETQLYLNEIIEEYFKLDSKNNYYSLQGFLNRKRLLYIFHRLEYIGPEEIFDSNGDVI